MGANSSIYFKQPFKRESMYTKRVDTEIIYSVKAYVCYLPRLPEREREHYYKLPIICKVMKTAKCVLQE